jgi:copper homeostasis protein
VTGLLTAAGKVDKERTSELVTLAYPLGVTFHRAFDRTEEPFEAMKDIIETGCERILTSGQKNNASDGAVLIKQLIDAADDRIIIMPGSGIRAENIRSIAEITGASEFHTSARCYNKSKMIYKSAIDTDSGTIGVDEEEVRTMIKLFDFKGQR